MMRALPLALALCCALPQAGRAEDGTGPLAAAGRCPWPEEDRNR